MSRLLITGGTGSLGRCFLWALVNNKDILPDVDSVVIFSRDEEKQWRLKNELGNYSDREIIFRIGDIRDYFQVRNLLLSFSPDTVINAAAMKQVPTCEYFPDEAVKTNVLGILNIINNASDAGVRKILGISTDKACQPINAMGMSKALMEKILAASSYSGVECVCVRYGNVLASRGSVIPLFYQQIKSNKPPTITSKEMTRFLLTLDDAINTILFALQNCHHGEICVPRCLSNKIIDVADIMCKHLNPSLHWVETGVRPGEKIHEVLVNSDEMRRAYINGDYFIIGKEYINVLDGEYRSDGEDVQRSIEGLEKMLKDGGFLD